MQMLIKPLHCADAKLPVSARTKGSNRLCRYLLTVKNVLLSLDTIYPSQIQQGF